MTGTDTLPKLKSTLFSKQSNKNKPVRIKLYGPHFYLYLSKLYKLTMKKHTA